MGASAPFLLGVAMRYLLLLLCVPSIAFAGCAVGVNYGHRPAGSPPSFCAPYTGSSLGGCTASCGTVCVEFPAAIPPTVGPYMSTGAECQYGNGDGKGDGDGDGKGDGKGDGGNPYGDLFKGWDYFKQTIDHHVLTGSPGNYVLSSDSDGMPKLNKNIALGFGALMNSIHTDINDLQWEVNKVTKASQSAEQTLKEIKEQNRVMKSSLEAIPLFLSRMEGTLDGSLITLNKIADSGVNSGTGTGTGTGKEFNQDRLFGTLDAIHRGSLNAIDQKLSSINTHAANIEGSLGSNGMAGNISAMRQMMEKGAGTSGTGTGTGQGDKPCQGPLCSFNAPSGGSDSALSSIFDDKSLSDIKDRILAKDQEIKSKMDDIKKVFVSEEITIEGEYNSDIQDIHGVKVDLSGKSNFELFFNSGPKQAIWFLVVLIAFTILMGGRKNA